MKISADSLRGQIVKILEKNLSHEHAEVVANYFMWAEMSGNKTQGIVKLMGASSIQNIKPHGEIEIIKDTKLSQIIDANDNPAPLNAQVATDVAIQKANEHGFAIIGVKNTFSSNGAQAYYVEQIAKHDLIGIMCSRSPASQAAFGGIDPVFGTDPIGFGFPTLDAPLVFDAATSAMTFYGLVLANARGEKIPENMAIDKDGNPTTDPAAAMSGALLPFDRSYKGSGFAMIVETLAGPLLGGAWVDNKTFKEEWGTVVIAIDPDLMVGRDEFKKNVSDMVSKIRSSRVVGDDMVRLPGENAQKQYEAAAKNGEVEIDDVVAKEIGITQEK